MNMIFRNGKEKTKQQRNLEIFCHLQSSNGRYHLRKSNSEPTKQYILDRILTSVTFIAIVNGTDFLFFFYLNFVNFWLLFSFVYLWLIACQKTYIF